jgi:hypothetical protein
VTDTTNPAIASIFFMSNPLFRRRRPRNAATIEAGRSSY